MQDPSLERPPPGDDRPPEAVRATPGRATPSEPRSAGPPADAGGPGLVTLLFTDIVGSTELLARLGDDTFELVRRNHVAMLRESVAASGGTEVKNLGDGLMAVFASAVDALGCAVRIQQSVARQSRRSEERRLEVRVGLHVGDPIRDETDYFGMPVVVAKRLCDAAGAGQIVVSRLVAELVGTRGGFDFEQLGPLVLKGLSIPVQACRLGWAEEPPRPLPPALAGLRERAFVGRGAELAQMEDAWRRVQGGRREVLLVGGEPGIGKTTLAVRVADAAWEAGAVVLFGRCDEESVVAFQPWVESLSHYIDNTPPAELRSQLRNQAGDLALLVPGMDRLLPEIGPVAGTGAETERYRIFESVCTLFAAIGAEAPVVLLLDDLHWADRPTLQLLQHLIRRAADVPLLIIGTYRDTDLVRTHPMAEALADLRRANLVARIPLRGLSADDVVDLVTAGNPPEPADKELARALWEETEGSPLFLREILRHLAETGAIDRDADRRWMTRRRIDQLGIPEGIREVIGRRLTRLSDTANTALRTGSVQGREIRLDVLEQVTELSTDELLDALDEATAAGVVDEITAGPGRWTFTHALVRQALYEELSLTRRVRLHQRVAEALEQLHGADAGPHLAELAFHFSQAAVAGRPDKAIEYARRAGEYAMTLAAYEAAARHFATAVEVADDAGADDTVRADLLIAQGGAEWRAGDARVARATFERVIALVGTADPQRRARAALGYAGGDVRPIWVDTAAVNDRAIALLEDALGALPDGDSELRARLMACLAQELHFLAGAEDRRRQLSGDAIAMGRRLGAPATLFYLLAARNLATMGPDNPTEIVENSSEMLALAEALGDRELQAHALRHRCIGLSLVDDMAAATRDLERWTKLVEELKDPVAAGIGASFRGAMLVSAGHFDEAESVLASGFRLSQEARDPNGLGVFMMPMGLLRMLQGRIAELVNPAIAMGEQYPAVRGWVNAALAMGFGEIGMAEEARQYLALVAPTDTMIMPRNAFWMFGMSMVARACFRLNDTAMAEDVYQLLVPHSGLNAGIGLVGCGSVDFAIAMAAVTARRPVEAERHFEVALAANRANGFRAWVVENQIFYAVFLADRDGPGDRERCLAHLSDVVATGGELGMAAHVREGAALQAELLGHTVPGDTAHGERRRLVTRRDRFRAKVTTKARAAVARWTRDDADEELVHRFISNLAQRTLLGAMARAFQPAMAFGFEGDIVFELLPLDEVDPAASDWWTIEIRGSRATARRGTSDNPAVCVHVRLADFVRLASGELHPVHALVEGTIEVEGDIMVAARIPDMFGAVEPLEGLARSAI